MLKPKKKEKKKELNNRASYDFNEKNKMMN